MMVASPPFLGRGLRGGSQRGRLIEYYLLLTIIEYKSDSKIKVNLTHTASPSPCPPYNKGGGFIE
ncbi:hypothetical protein MNBD_PLANCTO02-2415 [hydrothermal vent metagenome]|uniref:Uncharacterized protein n=1 Tax=hydrothermal vent metagenome TaxID=652676 RepID=A0A3B1DRH6_9ZZZZ